MFCLVRDGGGEDETRPAPGPPQMLLMQVKTSEQSSSLPHFAPVTKLANVSLISSQCRKIILEHQKPGIHTFAMTCPRARPSRRSWWGCRNLGDRRARRFRNRCTTADFLGADEDIRTIVVGSILCTYFLFTRGNHHSLNPTYPHNGLPMSIVLEIFQHFRVELESFLGRQRFGGS